MKNMSLLKSLVEINSTNNTDGENKVVDFLKSYLAPYANKIKIIGKEHKNILAFFGNLESKNILILNGHVDTVAAKETEWKTNPYELKIVDNRVYGRGVGDMKGGIACMLNALIRAKQEKLLKNKLIIFAGTCDEESGASSLYGAQAVVDYFLKNGIEPQGCLIPEPARADEKFRINLGHRGLIWIKAISTGVKMYSGSIENENNAITNMIDFLYALRKKITNQPKKDMRGIPETSARATSIKAESEFNVIPNYCECFIDVRVGPYDKNKNVIKKIQKLSIKYGVKIEVQKNIPQSSIRRSAKIITKLTKCLNNMEQEFSFGFSSATNDAHFFNDANIPTIAGLGVFASNVHAVDEYIDLKSINLVEELYYNLIKEW